MPLQYSCTSNIFISSEKRKEKMTLKIISNDLKAQSKTDKKHSKMDKNSPKYTIFALKIHSHREKRCSPVIFLLYKWDYMKAQWPIPKKLTLRQNFGWNLAWRPIFKNVDFQKKTCSTKTLVQISNCHFSMWFLA